MPAAPRLISREQYTFQYKKELEKSNKQRHEKLVEDFKDDLPSKPAEGTSIKDLFKAMDKIEGQVASGSEVTVPHPYGEKVHLGKMRELRQKTKAAEQAWKQSGHSESGELSVKQLADVFKGESADLSAILDTKVRAYLSSQQDSVKSANKSAFRSYLSGSLKVAGYLAMSLGAAAFGTAAAASGGVAPMLLVGTTMAVGAHKLATLDGVPGKKDFEHARSLKEAVESLPKSNEEISSLENQQQGMAALSEEALAWNRLL